MPHTNDVRPGNRWKVLLAFNRNFISRFTDNLNTFDKGQNKHLFSFLNSRISNPVYSTEVAAAGTLSPTIGRRNSDAFIENKLLRGFRAQWMLGDILRFGFTYVNIHKEHPQREDNPWTGTVANTPPETIVLVFRDNSPEDYLSEKPNGAKVKWVKFEIQTYNYDPETKIRTKNQLKVVEKFATDAAAFGPTTFPVDDPYTQGGYLDESGAYWTADGFDSFQCVLDMEEAGIDPRTVESVTIKMKLKGDYWIEVLGYSSKNLGALEDAWPKDETGLIPMPFRDVIEAPGNDLKDQKTAKTITYEYGAARGASLWGLDIEGSIPYLGYVQAQYAVNPKYKQYPTISKDTIGYSQLTADNPDDPSARTFSEVDGEAFESKLAGDDNDGRDKAWFINLKQRRGKVCAINAQLRRRRELVRRPQR